MAEGLLDRPEGAASSVAALELITSTPGMTVQMYGANGEQPPASITDPAWVQLSPSRTVEEQATLASSCCDTTKRVPLRRAVDQQGAGLGGRHPPGPRARRA